MTTFYSRRAQKFLDPAPHQQTYKDLHDDDRDPLSTARGMLTGLAWSGVAWAVFGLCVWIAMAIF